ncbi:SDR family NAD(P)-dependent oxidoreductase [Microbacterium ulmi]|uniref:SDR family NAD(P)-dependent oxidoreductase n=1 Tax=Microbacterium ulmi TaxID=179095 RepID=A0A7Y2Q297_9MICO|nr:SDR family NAD(P)-dependent oxidoreductase [Microbacterium ulmi]NII70524.1 NAD(P)-dependent dehydrogenase (short-subunit alcohol dehydrogenase family) [Microbacterium ulmi]NNH05202.1 SDR family NAD(P)-dependent oxidoreductase [Microbacterium ulmi]
MSPSDGVMVLTGSTSGIGLETARRLAARTTRLVVHGVEGRSAAAAAIERISSGGRAEIVYVPGDFSRLETVAETASAIATAAGGPIAVLVNNAAVPGSPARQVTGDGHERTLQIDYLAAVLLTERLRSSLTDGARIVNLASATHTMTTLDLHDIELEHGYTPVRAYARSKLAIIMYTLWLARHGGRTATPVSLSPGVVNTRLLDAMFGPIGTTVEHGARNVLAALDAHADGGEYFDDGRLVVPSAEALDRERGDALMDWTANALSRFV